MIIKICHVQTRSDRRIVLRCLRKLETDCNRIRRVYILVNITGHSLPYRTNTVSTVRLFSCCWSQSFETSYKPKRVLDFRLLYRLCMKYTFIWDRYASAPKVRFQLITQWNYNTMTDKHNMYRYKEINYQTTIE